MPQRTAVGPVGDVGPNHRRTDAHVRHAHHRPRLGEENQRTPLASGSHGLHHAATALATAPTAPIVAAPATIRARIFSSRPKLKPAVVVAVNEPSEETRSSWCHPPLNSESALPTCRQLSLSRINAPSSCAVLTRPTRWLASVQSSAGSSILISCLESWPSSCSRGASWAMASQRSLTASGFLRI